MINAGKLLADLKRLRKVLDADLRATHAAGAQRDAVHAEWREAFDLGRTRDTFEAFLDGVFDQAVVHWVLGCVFLRFLEDNLLVDRPFLSGPGERLDLAKERQEAHFRALPHDSDTEYLLATFGEAARLPGMAGLFDPTHNPLFRLPLSGDGAMALIRFFREVLPETGELTNDFTDPDWNTRFLGDLYQDLSEEARERYALLQTPDFVESWILDRTLEPAIREFGHERATMIDPACGSGHFLLGGFARLLREWQRFAPGLPAPEQAQRALSAIAGVDLNPFAVEIARFRLLVAALRAADVHHLAAAPGFVMHVAAGDSLLHGRHFFLSELGGAAEGFRRVLQHHYAAEDTAELDRILERQYHAVVGNPPYITPKDAAMRDAYREIYQSCHMNYAMVAPFVERFFDLAKTEYRTTSSGFVGIIVGNSFMKREFGSKLVEQVIPNLDLTEIVDCSGAYIPGHGTPTLILFGRNRRPVSSKVRAIVALKGDTTIPKNPANAAVWTSLTQASADSTFRNEFAEAVEIERRLLSRHPLILGSSAKLGIIEQIEKSTIGELSGHILDSGRVMASGYDDFYFLNTTPLWMRNSIPFVQSFSKGDNYRDWTEGSFVWSFSIISENGSSVSASESEFCSSFWKYRTTLAARLLFEKPVAVTRGNYAAFSEYYPERHLANLKLCFPLVATHNHFCVSTRTSLLNHSAPIIRFQDPDSTFRFAAMLNSSIACYWMKTVFHNKGSTVDQAGARQRTDEFEDFYEFTVTGLRAFPIVDGDLGELGKHMDALGRALQENSADEAVSRGDISRAMLDASRGESERLRSEMISLQEELDWRCYRLYGQLEYFLNHPDPPPLRLGERAFEIAMARRIAAGDPETTWFERHRSTPTVEIPAHWPLDYRALVERRISLIQSNEKIGSVERPEFKRRWSSEPWADAERSALGTRLLDRIEALPIWMIEDPRLRSTNQLTDLLRKDDEFLSLAALYLGRPDVDLEALLAELVAKESVPFLASLRYAETGLRKWVQWESTWDKQRQEDAIDADVSARRDTFRAQAERRGQEQWQAVNPRRPGEEPEPYAIRMHAGAAPTVEQQIDRLVAEEQRRRKRAEVGDIPVPPKYVTKDFQSTDFWRLRGGLDVPKERFVSFPHCQRDADGSLVVTWAGHNHLKRALAIAAYYQERKDGDGWPAERLVPLLAGVIELVPWLLQWHNEYDPDLGARMGDYFVDFVQTEARALGMTEAAVAAWTPPATPRRGRTRRAA